MFGINISNDNIWVCIILFLVGLFLIVKGADFLTDGASAVARKLKVSTLVIGLTIVAFGTSLPELVVSTISSMEGHGDMSMGNVVGSNIFNTLAIVGITALFLPIYCKKDLLIRDIPMNIIVSIMLMVLVFFIDGTNVLTRTEGIALLVVFAIYLWATFYTSMKKSKQAEEEAEYKGMPMWKAGLLICIGLAFLVLGGNWLVDGASGIATKLGVSESIIALTIVSAGTSIPELATSVVAARKGDADMAMGNVVGSNIFNILFILGVASTLSPITMGDIGYIDFVFMIASVLLLALFGFFGKQHKINRWHGMVLTATIIIYYVYLIVQATNRN